MDCFDKQTQRNQARKKYRSKNSEQIQQFIQDLYLNNSLTQILKTIQTFERRNNKKLQPEPQEITEILNQANLALEFGNNICFYGLGDKEEAVASYF